MRNRDSDKALIEAAARLREPTVYALAKAVNRPYRRVLERVKTLADAGRLQLEPITLGGRTAMRVSIRRPVSKATPTPFPVTWSRPDRQVPVATQLAAILLRPSFSGLLDAVQRYGLTAVERTAAALSKDERWNPRVREDAQRMLQNIRIGHDRAAA